MVRDLFRRLGTLPAIVWGLGFVSLLTDVASDMVYPLLPKLLERVGGGALALGLMEGVAELMSAALKVGAGSLVDRGARAGAFVVGGYGIAALARPGLSIATAPWQVVLLRSLDRVGKGIRSAPRDSILARSVDRANRALAFGVHRGLDNLGAVIGGGIAFLLLGVGGLSVEAVLLASVIPGLLSTVVAILAVRRDPSPEPAVAEGLAARAKVPLTKPVRGLLAVVAVFSLAVSADSFLLAYLMHQGLAVKWIPIAWITLQLGKALLNVPGGRVADRIGPRRAVLASWLVYAACYVLFAFSPGPGATWGLFAVYAVHYGLGEGAEKALLVELCPPEARGRALGLLAAISGGALLGANLIFGGLFGHAPALAFQVGATIALAGSALFVVAVPARRPSHQDA